MPQLSAVGHGRLAEPDRGVAPPTNNTAPQERGVVLRKALSRLWPQGSQADVLKRELVLLLLEDPDHRLRIAHCDDLMQSRLPGMYTCNGHSPIKLAVAHDPVSQCIFSIEPATPALPTCMGLSTEWGQAVLRLDTSELARCCTHVQDGQVPCVPLIPPPRTAPSARPSAMEQALLLAVAATWPQHDTDDDEYVATALGYVLTSKQDPQLQLPPCSLHLSDLQAWLRVITCNDARLTRRCASILGESPAGAPHSASHSATSSNMGKEAYKEQVHQQVQVKGDPSKEASGGRKAAGKAAAGRMQELLAQPRFKGLLKMRDATSARRGDKVVVLCVDKLAAPSPGAVLPEHLLHWMRVEAAADSAGLLPRAPTPPALVPHDAPANGHTSPGLPKFLFEYEAPELLLHTAPHFGSPIAQRAGGRHAFSMLDTGAVPRALSEPMGSDSNSNSAPSPYSSGHNAAAVMAASRAAAMRPVEPPSFEGKQAPRRGDIFDGLAGSSPPNRLGSGSPTTPSATGPAAGLASNYPAPGTSPSSQGGGHLFGSSPTVGGLKHVPQAIASCWGGGAAGGMQPQQPPQQQQQQQQQAPGGHAPIGPPSAASSSRKRSEGPGSDAHLRGGGAHGQPLARGVQPSAAGDNMSPPSALDASFALLGGSHGSSGSHVGGANGVDPVYWGSGSPEVTNAYRVSGSGGASSSSIALAAARGNMRAAWSGQACSGAPGPVGGGAAPPGSEALQQCTPSSVSEVSEDCGVHGPPDLETTLEAIMSFGEHINEPHGARAAAAAAAHKSFAAAAASAVAGVPPGGYAGPDAVLGGLHGEPHLQPGTGQKAMAAAGRDDGLGRRRCQGPGQRRPAGAPTGDGAGGRRPHVGRRCRCCVAPGGRRRCGRHAARACLPRCGQQWQRQRRACAAPGHAAVPKGVPTAARGNHPAGPHRPRTQGGGL